MLGLAETLTDHSALDLLTDDLGLKTLTLGNLMTLFGYAEITGAYFFLPLAVLNLVIRCDRLSSGARLNLIQTAFSVFFKVTKEFRATGNSHGIYEASSDGNHRKTFWTKKMCMRGCNLCIGLFWAISTFGEGLALGRIGRHSVETCGHTDG
jgi:hypothetical protein